MAAEGIRTGKTHHVVLGLAEGQRVSVRQILNDAGEHRVFVNLCYTPQVSVEQANKIGSEVTIRLGKDSREGKARPSLGKQCEKNKKITYQQPCSCRQVWSPHTRQLRYCRLCESQP